MVETIARVEPRELLEIIDNRQFRRECKLSRYRLSLIWKRLQGRGQFFRSAGAIVRSRAGAEGPVELFANGILLAGEAVHDQSHVRAQSLQERIDHRSDVAAEYRVFHGRALKGAAGGLR